MKQEDHSKPWPTWQLIAFRFVFCYFSLHLVSYPFFHGKPGFGFLHTLQNSITGSLVTTFNSFVAVVPGFVPRPGTIHDTQYKLVQIVLYLFLAAVITVVWSFFGRRQKSYRILNYYLSTALRYFLSFISFLYGTYKLFGIQMPQPTTAQLYTPFGNLNAMEMAWLHIGYSAPYQFFLGLIEVLLGVLLIYRRTTFLGVIMAFVVYVDVMVINFCYDISVKMFSTYLVLICIYLLLPYCKNLADFFIFNRAVSPIKDTLTRPKIPLWMIRAFRGAFLALIALMFVDRFMRMDPDDATIKPIPPGVYEVHTFVKNNDTLPVLAHDSLMWKDFIFEAKGNVVTINSADTLFSKSEVGGTFRYKANTLNKKLICYKINKAKAKYLFTLHYNIPHKNEVEFRTTLAGESLYLKLVKSSHKYKLGQNQFHLFLDHEE